MATSTVIGEFSRLHEDAIDFEFASSQDSIQIHDPPVKNEGITGYRDREAAKDC